MSTPSDLNQFQQPREKLVKRSHLILLALALLVVLALLAPTSNMLLGALGGTDQLSLQYLQLLIAVHPADVGLKLRLAQTLFANGELAEASQLLDSLPRTDPHLQQAMWQLGLRIHLAQYAQDPARAVREQKLVPLIIKDVETLLSQPLSNEDLAGLATSSLSIGQPALAGRIYLRLAETDPAQRSKWLAAAAQQELASSQPADAGARYEQLAQDAKDPQERRHYALLAMNAYTGANQGDKALAVAKRFLQQFPDDVELLAAAGKLALANNHPADAATYYDALVKNLPDVKERVRYAKLALLSFAAANQPERALLTAGRYVAEFPSEVALLESATQLALANQKPHLAQTWGRAMLAQNRHDNSLIADQIDIELAAGDAAAGLALAQRLVAQSPGNRKQRERLAQLALWNNQPGLALTQLAYLALHTRDQSFLEKALKMAPQLYELETLADLLAVKARRGRLTDTELASLVETYEGIGKPEELVQVLDEYLQHYADHRAAWEALAAVQERRGDLQAALATFERISRNFGSSIKEVTHRAELLWQLHQPSKAYVLLRDALDHAGIATTHELLNGAELTAQRAEADKTNQAADKGADADKASDKVTNKVAGKGAEKVAEKGADKAAVKDPAKDLDKDQQAFLKLLAELLWQSEPRPETLDEYRLLWQKNALLRESTERYINLTEDRELPEEALRVSVEAFNRYKEPEFLLEAMDYANKLGRYADMERLIELARQHDDLFANNKRYYLTLAE